MKFENDILYLSLCALNNVTPDVKRVEKMDLSSLYKYCQLQKITALVCYALETVIQLPDQWLEAKGKAIRKNMLFDVERQQITASMDKNGIKYLPLKGILLKEYYPKIGMREMSDNDIYYDIAFRDQLEAIMVANGYDCTQKENNHDVYEKQPIYNFEMHHALFQEAISKNLYKYYQDFDNRMIKDENNACGYHLSVEDFYIYLIAHEYKHYNYSGTGIRSLLDCIVFLKKFGETLDWDYIKRETEKAGFADFEEFQRELCKKLLGSFTDVDYTQAEIDFLEYLVSSGVYGDFNTFLLNQIAGEGGTGNRKITISMKMKYIYKRIFIPIESYKECYPFFYKHKYLIPFCFFYRFYKMLFKRSKTMKNEIDILRKN